MPIKIAMSWLGRKLVALSGAVFLLFGIAILNGPSALHAYAPLVILVGSFSLCLVVLSTRSLAKGA
jgi:hypothetical protein